MNPVGKTTPVCASGIAVHEPGDDDARGCANQPVLVNDDWGKVPDITALKSASAAQGAFALADTARVVETVEGECHHLNPP